MIRRKACFVCTTPYQIIESIAIVEELKLDSDLYIYGTFDGYENVANKLKYSKIFVSVITIDYNKYHSISLARTFWESLNYKHISSKILPQNVSYDYFYTSTRSHTNLILLYELVRRNTQMYYVYFEDGIGTYEKNMMYLVQSKGRKYTELLLGINSLKPQKTIIMAMFPKMLEIPDVLKGAKIFQQPRLNFSGGFNELVGCIFSLKPYKSPLKKIIVFDTFRVERNLNTIEIKMMDVCLKEIEKLLPTNSFMYKPHPRSGILPDINSDIEKLDGTPAELFFTQIKDLDNCVFIGNLSTSLFSPKLLFNKEPIIISLHKIVIPYAKNWFSMFDKVQSLYKHKDRMIAPNTLSEFQKICNYIKNNIDAD